MDLGLDIQRWSNSADKGGTGETARKQRGLARFQLHLPLPSHHAPVICLPPILWHALLVTIANHRSPKICMACYDRSLVYPLFRDSIKWLQHHCTPFRSINAPNASQLLLPSRPNSQTATRRSVDIQHRLSSKHVPTPDRPPRPSFWSAMITVCRHSELTNHC